MLNVAEQSGAYWVYGALNRVDDNGVFMSINRPEVEGNVFGLSVAGDAFHISASLIRRDIYFQVGCFDPTVNTSEDIDLQCRIAFIGEIGRTDRTVADIRVGVWGNTTTQWHKKQADIRQVREKALNLPGALGRMRDSVKGDVNLRGRCCRAYAVSTVLNLKAGRFFSAASRLLALPLLASFYVCVPEFWRGLLMRSHWHQNEKDREYDHYAEYYPEKEVTPQAW